MAVFLLCSALAADPEPPSRDMPITPGPGAAADPSGAGETSAEKSAPEDGAPATTGPPPSTPPESGAPEAAIPPAEAPAATSVELTPEARRQQAADLYLDALDAWKLRKWSRAWRLASHALAVDPDLAPARLLAGYALLKLRREPEALQTLEGLALDAGDSELPEARRREAQRLIKAHKAPYRRDQWSFGIGTVFFLERVGDEPQVLSGYAFTGRAPIVERLSVRIDAGAPWSIAPDDLDVRGPRFAAYAVASQPLGRGRGHIDLAVGPVLWVATGRYWASGYEPYVGARAATSIDVRFGPTLGLRWEVGTSAFPEAAEALPFYAQPLDFRFAVEGWFGK